MGKCHGQFQMGICMKKYIDILSDYFNRPLKTIVQMVVGLELSTDIAIVIDGELLTLTQQSSGEVKRNKSW